MEHSRRQLLLRPLKPALWMGQQHHSKCLLVLAVPHCGGTATIIGLCHFVQLGTRGCSKTSYLSSFQSKLEGVLSYQSGTAAWTGPWPPPPGGSLYQVPPHRQPTRYAESASSTEITKMHQKSFPVCLPAQRTQRIFDGFEALKGDLCVLVLLEPPQRRWKGGIKHLNSPIWSELHAFITAKTDFFWFLLHILLLSGGSMKLDTPITGYSC